MTLLDHFKNDATNRFPSHQFSHACLRWALGKWTRVDIISKFNLQPNDEIQLDELKTHYQGLANNQKFLFVQLFEGDLELYEVGLISEQEVKDDLGLT